jgi:hypothetical protein
VAALAIIGAGAGAATVVLLNRDHSGSATGGGTATNSVSGSPSGSSGSSGTLPPATLQIVDAVNQPATGPLPSGWVKITKPAGANESAGFTIAAPAGWTRSTSNHQTYLRDPAEPDTNILIDLTPHTYPADMVAEAQYIKSRSLAVGSFPGYVQQGLAAHVIRGTNGSYWKYTWNRNGVTQQVIDLLFVEQTSSGPQSYALYMTAPASAFDQLRPTFDEEVETFAPLPK